MFESLIKEWGGEELIIRYDQPTGAWIMIAIHSTRMGPSGGGTRMKEYPDLEAAVRDVLRLSEGMTYKFAIPSMPFGGAKTVIALPPEFDPAWRNGLLRRYGTLIKQLGGIFHTGPDVGTSSEDMDIIAETGSPHVFARTEKAGGAGPSGPATAYGVYSGILSACSHLFGDDFLAERTVLVQGVGSVGKTLIDLLTKANAQILFSDVEEEIIAAYKAKGLEFVPPDQEYGTECDIFSPCALGGILSAETIPQLRCKGVVGGANNQLNRPEDGERLRARGILYAPDFAVNVGGALYIIGRETLGWSNQQGMEEVFNMVKKSMKEIFELSEKEGIRTETAAYRIADQRIQAAQK